MSGSLGRSPSAATMTKEAFNEMFGGPFIKERYEYYRTLYGKPRVRVQAERQTPNEADL